QKTIKGADQEIGTSAVPNQNPISFQPPLNIEIDVVQDDRSARQEIRTIDSRTVKQARDLITEAKEEGQDREKEAIYKAIELLYPYSPHAGQQEALHHLIYKRTDLILIAKTAFGKSMVLQAVSVLLEKTITLIILPLQQIGVEQAESIERIGGRPCFLNADTINPSILSEIKEGKYTHILISPELAIGDKFRSILLDQGFRGCLRLVAIDEAHLVLLWGKGFRTSYAKLNLIRSIIGAEIPWFACSATLDGHALNSLRINVQFNKDVKIQRTSINRPEIVIRRGFIPPSKGVKALWFLFSKEDGGITDDEPYETPQNIPKTFIFFDSRRVAKSATKELRRYLQGREDHPFTEADAREVVTTFQRKTNDFDKPRIIEKFKQPDSKFRVICATEALGMGVDVTNVRRAVQFSVHENSELAVIWQRGGRSSRDGCDGEMIFLFPIWTKGPRIQPSKNGPDESTQNSNKKQLKSSKTHDHKRGKLPNPIYDLVNDEGCSREFFLNHYSEP